MSHLHKFGITSDGGKKEGNDDHQHSDSDKEENEALSQLDRLQRAQQFKQQHFQNDADSNVALRTTFREERKQKKRQLKEEGSSIFGFSKENGAHEQRATECSRRRTDNFRKWQAKISES